jgi:hypothetical protein
MLVDVAQGGDLRFHRVESRDGQYVRDPGAVGCPDVPAGRAGGEQREVAGPQIRQFVGHEAEQGVIRLPEHVQQLTTAVSLPESVGMGGFVQ